MSDDDAKPLSAEEIATIESVAASSSGGCTCADAYDQCQACAAERALAACASGLLVTLRARDEQIAALRRAAPTDCGEAIVFVNDHFEGDFHAGERPARVLVRLLGELLEARAKLRAPGNIRAVDEIRACLRDHRENLRMWTEPNGWLIPTEPDPEERELVRERLKAAIDTLEWVLGEERR